MCPIFKTWVALTAFLIVSVAVLIGTVLAGAQTPEISYIELPTNAPKMVYIHFYTDPGHTYYLQYNNAMACTNCGKNVMATNWSNMFTGFNYPFSEHYVIVDSRTNKSRFYRLRMTTP
jgi:hypothetical protein